MGRSNGKTSSAGVTLRAGNPAPGSDVRTEGASDGGAPGSMNASHLIAKRSGAVLLLS
jgi:hypothetical protein